MKRVDLTAHFFATFATVRTAHFAACLLLAGIWAFDRLMIAPTFSSSCVTVIATWNRIAAALLWIALPMAALTTVGWFVLVAMSMSELPLSQVVQPNVLKLLMLHTRFGHAWLLHACLLMIASAGAILWHPLPAGRRAAAIAWSNLLVATAAVAGIAWAGHAATGPAPLWHRTADVLHLLICPLWPTGLLPLALLLIQLRRTDLRPADRRRATAALATRFSAWSLTSVAVLISTGFVNSWCLVGSPHMLWTTSYGQVLLLKLAAFLAILILGAANRLLLLPRLNTASADSRSTNLHTPERRLSRNLLFEIVLTSLLLAAVGVLGLLQPGRM